MKKILLLPIILLASVLFTSCETVEEDPLYNSIKCRQAEGFVETGMQGNALAAVFQPFRSVPKTMQSGGISAEVIGCTLKITLIV